MTATATDAAPHGATAPTAPDPLRAGVGTTSRLGHLLAAVPVDNDLVARLVAADPALTLRVLATANAGAAAGDEHDTVARALAVLDPSSLGQVVEAMAREALPAVPGLWQVLARALACERLSSDPRGNTVGLLSGVAAVSGVDLATLAGQAGVSTALADAVTAHLGPLGRTLAALLAYLDDDQATILQHGLDPYAVYSAYVDAATTAMAVEAFVAEAPAGSPPAAGVPRQRSGSQAPAGIPQRAGDRG